MERDLLVTVEAFKRDASLVSRMQKLDVCMKQMTNNENSLVEVRYMCPCVLVLELRVQYVEK